MRPLFVLAFLLVFFKANSQDLKNSEWVQIKAERKDGSKIISRYFSDDDAIKYYFTDSIVFASQNNQYSDSLKYSIHDNILSLGEYVHYNIDTINSIVMLLTAIPPEELPDDKINSYVFIKSNYLFKYLTERGELSIIGDSIIQTSKRFSPIYKGNLGNLLIKEYQSSFVEGKVHGSLILSPDGNVKNIVIAPESQLSKKETKIFINLLYSTKFNWSIPLTPKPFQFAIPFSCEFSFKGARGESHFFSLQTKQPNTASPSPLFSLREAEKHFVKGVDLFKSQHWEKALNEFAKCIEIDSFYLDAYYNEAICYQQLGQLESACGIWQTLKEMGQKQGELLYDENCSRNTK